MNQSMNLGRASEYLVTSMLLNEFREVYLPAVDDHGVDLLVRTIQQGNPHQFQEIQIKSISTGGLFAAINCPNPAPNYWFVFYIKDKNTMWLINSMDFTDPNLKLSSQNVKGKNIGKYSISLTNKNGFTAKCAKYIIKDFSTLP